MADVAVAAADVLLNLAAVVLLLADAAADVLLQLLLLQAADVDATKLRRSLTT